MNNSPWLFGVVVVVVVVLVWIWNPLAGWGDEVTQYTAKCAEEPTADAGCAGYQPLKRTIYRFDEDRREAVYWFPHEDGPPSGRLVDCLFRDIRNWTSDYSDGSGQVELRDGLRRRHEFAKRHNWVYLRRWQWWYLTLMSHLQDPVPFEAMVPEQFD